MLTRTIFAAALATVAGTALAPRPAEATNRTYNVKLSSFQEAPQSLVTAGEGAASLKIVGDTIQYRLRFSDTQGTVTQAHLHIGDDHTTGGVAFFICSNLGNGPAGTQACPTAGEVSGIVTAANIIGPAAQGVAAGEIADVIAAIKAGAAYINVHTDLFPPGEIRGNLHAHH